MRTLVFFTLAMISLGAAAQNDAAPLSLTASDGTGLELIELDVDALRQGPFAYTQVRMIFQNPKNRVIEGRFEITLPDSARVARFAMRLADGRLQEGEIVEKQKARRVYEDFLHRKQDPALLESAAGNAFRARVFPIPARGKKEIILSYSHSNNDEYRFALKGLPQIKKLNIALVGEKALNKTKYVPGQDYVVKNDSALSGLQTPQGFVVPVVPVASSSKESVKSIFLLVDTSASQALGLDARLQKLKKIIDEISARFGDVRVAVAAFDNKVTFVHEGSAADSYEIVKKLRARRALGASNLGGALAWISEAMSEGKARGFERLLIMGDGMATLGKGSLGEFEPVKKRLEASGVERVDFLVSGGIRDRALLEGLLDIEVKRAGTLIDADKSAVAIVNALERKTLRKVKVSVDGAKWFWPKQLSNVQAGEVRFVFAGGKTKSVRINDTKIDVKYQRGNRLLVGRELAGAQIAELLARESAAAAKDKEAIQNQIIELSKEARIISKFTSLLVLESEQDYVRYNIDRQALGEILVIKKGVLEEQERKAFVVTKPKPKPVKRRSLKAKSKKMKKRRAREGERESNEEAAKAQEPSDQAQDDFGQADDGVELDEESEAPMVGGDALAAAPMERRGGGGGDGRGRLGERQAPRKISKLAAYEGPFLEVQTFLEKGQKQKALSRAKAWREESPGDVLALVALGDAYKALAQNENAARAYASIIDLFSSRADLRRYAGNLLEALSSKQALSIAIDTYAKAVKERADHPASHRLLAYALVKDKRYDEAFDAIEKGLLRRYPNGRFRGVTRILQDDAGIIASVARKHGANAVGLEKRLAKMNASFSKTTSLRFILTWETDANDVDFHVYDRKNNHAYYSQPRLASGGELYADVTTGYGPECFAIEGKAKAAPYRMQAHYYSRGPMGYGMGTVQIMKHDGKGTLSFEERPFVVMKDGAYLELGEVR